MTHKRLEIEPDGSDLLAAMNEAYRHSPYVSFHKSIFDMIPRRILVPLPNRAYRVEDYHLEFNGFDDEGFVLFHITIRKLRQLRLL